MVQFIFEGSRTNFSFWSKFAYVLVRTGVNVDIQPPLEYFFSCSIFNFKYSKGGPLYIF